MARRLLVGFSHDFGKAYVGREAERNELSRALQARIRLCSVYGRGGIGKTALVCKVLSDLLEMDNPPDGVLTIGVTSNRIGFTQVLSGFARLLGGSAENRLAQLAQDPDTPSLEKAGMLTDILATGWYILLLDNLETLQHPQTGEILDADLRALFQAVLERGGLSIVITSQRQISLDRIQLVSERRILLSDGLPEDVAVNLLRQIDPDGSIGLRDALESELRQCAVIVKGYPRALEAVAGILLEDPLLSVDILCRNAAWLNNELSAIVQQAITRLEPSAMQVLQALSVFTHPVPVTALDTMLAGVMSNAALRSTLTHLVRGFFVHYSRIDQRVGLHPIDRGAAYHMIPKVDSDLLSLQTLHRRAAEYFHQQRMPQQEWHTVNDLLPILDEFEQWIALTAYDEAARVLSLIDRDFLWEWGQRNLLQALYDQLKGHIQDGYLDRQHRRRLVWLRWSDDVPAAQQRFESILDDARAAADRQSEADALDDLAQTDRRQMRFWDGMRKHQQALEIYREIGDLRGQADALGGVGSVLTFFDPDSAIAPFQEALAIHRAIGSTASLTYTLNYLGVAHQAAGNFETARAYLLEVLEWCNQYGIKVREGEAMQWLGIIALHMGDNMQAVEWANRLLALAHDSEYLTPQQRKVAEQIGYHLLGSALYRDDPQRGLPFVQKAYELAQQGNNPIQVISTSTEYAYLLLTQRQVDQAVDLLAPLTTTVTFDIRFWAIYIVAQIVSGRSVNPLSLIQRITDQARQVPRQGRLPLWVQYPLTLLDTVADYWSYVDLASRAVEFQALTARSAAPGLVKQARTLIELLMELPGGDRLQTVLAVLRHPE